MAGMEGLLTKQVGPLPVGAWAAIAGVGGFIFVRVLANKKNAAANASGSAATGQGDTFSSGQTTTTTDPTTGNTTTSTYNAQGNGYLPGMLSWGAGPMPIQEGDVYVNLPAQNQTTPTAPATPTTPGQLKNVASHIFPGSTNITWTLGDGDTTEVLITAKGPSWSVNETVDVKGQKAGANGGHMFYIDAPSRGATINYTLTPMNEGVAGPPSQITATNAQ